MRRVDSAERSFLGLMAVSFVAFVALGLAACGLLSVIAYQAADDGLDALAAGGRDLRPAAVFLAVLAAGTIRGLWALRRGLTASRALGRRVRQLSVSPPARLTAAAHRRGLARRVRLVACPEPFSFAYGAISPRVAVSRGLVELASDNELEAVLEHERYHVHHLDPLKVLLARALPSTLFFLPALGDLRARYVARRELAADRRAARMCGRRSLAGAVLKVIRGPAWPELRAAAAIGGAELLAVRIEQLERGAEPEPAPLARWRLAISTLALAALAAMFALALAALGGPTALLESGDLGRSLEPSDIALTLACLIPWFAAVAAVYAVLAVRARRQS